jgi:hypothetical protein
MRHLNRLLLRGKNELLLLPPFSTKRNEARIPVLHAVIRIKKRLFILVFISCFCYSSGETNNKTLIGIIKWTGGYYL